MDSIQIDFKGIETRESMHQLLQQKLNFADYYGKNLDALFDCLTEIPSKTQIFLYNVEDLKENLAEYGINTIQVFEDAQKMNANIQLLI